MSTKLNSSGDFQDPLENYDGKKYDDPLECALAEENVAVMQHEPFVTIPPTISVAETVGKLARIGSGEEVDGLSSSPRLSA